jgi:hypothetical protein
MYLNQQTNFSIYFSSFCISIYLNSFCIFIKFQGFFCFSNFTTYFPFLGNSPTKSIFIHHLKTCLEEQIHQP